jgi:GT2 family glycosyltransferase
VPTVASPAGPFRRAITHGVTGFLAGTEDEWYDALTRLAADAALRHRVAQSAYHVALGRFGPAARARAFAQMLAQAQGGAAGAAAFERDRYRATLPATVPPVVPAADTILSIDQRGMAGVTVIVPVFNYSDFVPEALQSVAAQTLAVLDLVVIDDASPDDSLAMVQDWVRAHAGRFNRIVILRHRENAGLGFARNSGFAAAESPFVLPLDADNRLRPAACETLLAAMAASDAAFAYPAIQQFGTKSAVFGRDPYSVLRLQGGNYIDAMALVRKSAWAEAGGYDHVQYGWEDYDFWCRLAERGHFGVAVPEVLADYRVHAQSMLHTMTEVQDHKNDLVADLKRRHPWLDVPRKKEHGT